MMTLVAKNITVDHCAELNCPEIILCDERNNAIAVARVPPDMVDELIAMLREALAVSDARMRPVS